MIYNEMMINLRHLIGNNVNGNVYAIFKTAETAMQNKEVSFRIEPKMTNLFQGLNFKKENTGGVCIAIGQKYIDTYKKDSSLHHTMLIHELKHLADYLSNRDTFFDLKVKQKYFYEFDARNIEIEFIKTCLVGKLKLTKYEELLLKSFELDDLDFHSILFQRVSKHIYCLFRDIETEYRANKNTIENICRELFNGGFQLINEYRNSKDDQSRYVNFVKVKSFRNCFEDIVLENGNGQKIVLDYFIRYDELNNIYNELYKIIDDYQIANKNYLLSLDAYLEKEYMSN